MALWRPFRPLQSAPSHKSLPLQEPCKQTLEKLVTLLHHRCPCSPRPLCPSAVQEFSIDTQEKKNFCFSRSLKSSGQPAFKLDCKHRRFPWLPKNTYQQLPVTEGQIPVSSTNSAFFIISCKKNRGVGGKGKILFLLQCTLEQHPTSPPTKGPKQSLQVLEIATQTV